MEDRSSTIMDFHKYKNFILLLLLVIMFSSTTENRGLEGLSKQGVEVHKHSKHVNNHIIKTFQDKYGEVIDCVDIYKQPSLAHPLLTNHQVQLKPQSIPKNMFIEESMNTSLVFSGMIECPQGYVPIKRTSKEDLMMTWHLQNLTKFGLGKDSEDQEIYDAKLEYGDKHYGVKGSINVWSIDPFPDKQLSMAFIWIADGPPEKENDIVAGWIVYPDLFKDKKTRLFAYWNVITSRNFGCFNILCPGFVQINRKIHLGSPVTPLSIYEGQQYSINTEIYQDHKTKHWWLRIKGENLGYWPVQLFPFLKDGANYASWGGRVISPQYDSSAQMGSGEIPVVSYGPVYEFNGRVAYIRHVQVNTNGTFDDPLDVSEVVTDSDKFCYGLDDKTYQDGYWNYHIYYGGPGNCSDTPPI